MKVKMKRKGQRDQTKTRICVVSTKPVKAPLFVHVLDIFTFFRNGEICDTQQFLLQKLTVCDRLLRKKNFNFCRVQKSVIKKRREV